MQRDEFLQSIKETLARRVALRCSNPECRKATGGPHTDPSRAMNIGVAAHITAAAAGGPRYAPLLSMDQRSSIENAVWLCQSCSKLIDSDTTRYSTDRLNVWKTQAEQAALLEFETRTAQTQQPVPASTHAPVPNLAGKSYDEARELLIAAGWQPLRNHWTHGTAGEFQYGNGKYFWEKGYWEIRYAGGCGIGQCAFDFEDVYLNHLVVLTAGEVHAPTNSVPGVDRWIFERNEESA